MEKEALYALPVYGDILAVSILQLAQKNPGITVADVERNLCGLKTKKKIKNVYYSGRFRLLPCRNVLEMIDRLMDMRLILKVQSGFSRQFVLTITKDGENFLELPFRQLHTKFCEFNDSEWCEFLKEHDYTNDRYAYSEKEKQEFLHLLEHRNVVLTQHDVWLQAFLKNVDGWQEFVRKQAKGAGISDKAYWRFVENITKRKE